MINYFKCKNKTNPPSRYNNNLVAAALCNDSAPKSARSKWKASDLRKHAIYRPFIYV